jgi:hypothetical protein
MCVAHAPSILREPVEAAPALGFRAFGIFVMDVQFKGRLDVYASINIKKNGDFRVSATSFSDHRFTAELLVSHQKIVDTRFRQ